MPKLTLRDLFAIVTIVALALGWWLDRSRLAAMYARTAYENAQLRIDVRFLADHLEEKGTKVFFKSDDRVHAVQFREGEDTYRFLRIPQTGHGRVEMGK
jgi:hypothetical protein